MRNAADLDVLLAIADAYLSSRVVQYPMTEGERACEHAFHAVLRARRMIAASPAAEKAGDLSDAEIDLHLDRVLRAAGSALKHYSMPKSLDDLRAAMRAAMKGGAA